jgi:signal transduction histidine kinase
MVSGVSGVHADAARLAGEQAALRRVAELVARGAAPAVVLEAVAAEACALVGVDSTALLRFDADGSSTIVALHGAPPELTIGYREPATGDGTVQRVFRTRRTARVDSYAELSGPEAERARRLGVVASEAAPVLVHGHLWGVIVAMATSPVAARGLEAGLADFAELAAVAIAGAQSREDLRELVEEQAALRRVAVLVARGASPETLFDAVATEACRLLGGHFTPLLRYDADGTAVIVAMGGAERVAHVMAVGMRLAREGDGMVQRVQRTARATRVGDYEGLPGANAATARALGLNSGVCAPILTSGRVWGAIAVMGTRDPLPGSTEGRLALFADLVATAIANAQARAALATLADEQAALRRVAELVARGAPLEEVFTAVAREASVLLGDGPTALHRYDPDGYGTVVAAQAGPGWSGVRVPSDGGTGAELVRRTSAASTGEALGVRSAVSVPVLVEGRVWGDLSTSTPGSQPPAGTEDRLAQFAELAGAAIANAENKEKLRASRARVISTGDEARRRLQRDVHDGAQQRLVHTIIALKLARGALAEGQPPDELLQEALTHAERASTELRDIVRGILPAALTRGGLRAGLESLVADLALPVDVRVGAPRLPAPIETTAYFIVAEALTNVVKHARATRAEVEVALDDDALVIVVRDDGAGGAEAAGGTGLLGLSDRLDAGGGTLAVSSPPGGGTTVRAVLPVVAGPAD